MSTTMGVRFTDEERDWISQYATFVGESVSDVIRTSVFERIEDELDRRDYLEALSDTSELTTEEVAASLGIENVSTTLV